MVICAKWYVFVIYAVGMIAMCVLTAKDLYPLCTAYIENNIATEIHVVTGNESADIPVPSLVLCIPYDGETTAGLEHMVDALSASEGSEATCGTPCDELVKANWTGFRSVPWSAKQAANYKNYIRGAILSELFNTKIDEDRLTGSDAIHAVFDAAWGYFACITALDANFPNMYPSDCMHPMNYNPPPLPDRWRIDTVLRRLLRAVANNTFCYQTSIFGSCDNKVKFDIVHGVVNQSILTSFDDSGVCFSLPRTPEAFSIFYKSWITSGEYAGGDRGAYEIYEDSGLSVLKLIANLPEKNSEYRALYKSPPQPTTGPLNTENVTLQYRTTIRVLETRPSQSCYSDIDLSTCIMKCRVNKIVQSCNCVPFSYRNLVTPEDHTLEYCNPTDQRRIVNCSDSVPSLTEDCEAACGNQPCSYTYYDWMISSSIAKGRPESQGLSLIVRPTSTPGLQFNVVYRDSVPSFIANVGGIANLYLGIDGLMLCGILIALIDCCCEGHRSKRAGKTAPNSGTVADSMGTDVLALRMSALEAKVEQLGRGLL